MRFVGFAQVVLAAGLSFAATSLLARALRVAPTRAGTGIAGSAPAVAPGPGMARAEAGCRPIRVVYPGLNPGLNRSLNPGPQPAPEGCRPS